ncbi:MAG: FAD-binding and (Fe-S)-binding domain-containing protein [Bacteroidales bacterium]
MPEAGMKKFIAEMRHMLGRGQVLTNELSVIAYGADAGCYHKRPQVIVKPGSEEHVSSVLKRCFQDKLAVTFRAAGTSLSGQAISDSVLLVAPSDQWRRTEVLENGKIIRTQPGITGARINQILAPYGVKFGPDPASVNSAMIGGIIANNASGMSCGTHANSYATITAARIIFYDGTVLDTADEFSRKEFERSKPEIIRSINSIKKRISNDLEISTKIIQKYRIKNTCGYGMNSFIDFDDPVDIILHLMIGSEGTLGFVSEVTFRTIEVKPARASAMIYFRSLTEACNTVPLLKEAGAAAVELMDRQSLRSVENQPGIPGYIKNFGDSVTALLIDLEAANLTELDMLVEKTQKALGKVVLEREFQLTTDAREMQDYWKVRKGIFPSVGAMRKPGTAVIIEDVAVKLEHLTAAVTDLRQMLDDLDYSDAVIYGHAMDGNLHFIFSQDFEKAIELSRYETLIRSLAELIVDKYNGSLKAEHGTGINMAPFVRYEWGNVIYGMMEEIKNTFDPSGILNPGVLINPDPEAHLKGFKSLPEIDSTVDKCIECGFCEINCLSTGYTLSARQRIVVQRELALLRKDSGNRQQVKRIEKDFIYAGDRTCATDGLCSISCPVDIDTGIYIKKLREQKINDRGGTQPVARWIMRNFGFVKMMMRAGLRMVNGLHRIFGSAIFGAITAAVRTISLKKIPSWNKFLPTAVKTGNSELHPVPGMPAVVYFPSCINQVMGPPGLNHKQVPLKQVTEEVLIRAGYQVLYPDNMAGLCCGMPWGSKGFTELADAGSRSLEKELLKISENGKYPVLCDTSPCVYRMKKVMDKRLKIVEPVEFIHDYLLDSVKLNKLQDPHTFHITCSSIKLGIEDKFRKVAEACVERPIFPEEVGCCGFAGDKGFSVPELNDWALRKLVIDRDNVKKGFSNSRTCEIGLSKKSGIAYESVMYMMEKVMY